MSRIIGTFSPRESQDSRSHRTPLQIDYQPPLQWSGDFENQALEFLSSIEPSTDLKQDYLNLITPLQLHSANLISFKSQYPKVYDEFLNQLFSILDHFLLQTKASSLGTESREKILIAADYLQPFVHVEKNNQPYFFRQGKTFFKFKRRLKTCDQIESAKQLYGEMQQDLVYSLDDQSQDMDLNTTQGDQRAYFGVSQTAVTPTKSVDSLPKQITIYESEGQEALTLPKTDLPLTYNWYSSHNLNTRLNFETNSDHQITFSLSELVFADSEQTIYYTVSDLFGNSQLQTLQVLIVNDVNEAPAPKISGSKNIKPGSYVQFKIKNQQDMDPNPKDTEFTYKWSAKLDGQIISSSTDLNLNFKMPTFYGPAHLSIEVEVNDGHSNHAIGREQITLPVEGLVYQNDTLVRNNNFDLFEIERTLPQKSKITRINGSQPNIEEVIQETVFDKIDLDEPTQFYDLGLYADSSGSMLDHIQFLADDTEAFVQRMVDNTEPGGEIRISLLTYGNNTSTLIFRSEPVSISDPIAIEQLIEDCRYYTGVMQTDILVNPRHQETLFHAIWNTTAGPQALSWGSHGHLLGDTRLIAITDEEVDSKENITAIPGDPYFDKGDTQAMLENYNAQLEIVRIGYTSFRFLTDQDLIEAYQAETDPSNKAQILQDVRVELMTPKMIDFLESLDKLSEEEYRDLDGLIRDRITLRYALAAAYDDLPRFRKNLISNMNSQYPDSIRQTSYRILEESWSNNPQLVRDYIEMNSKIPSDRHYLFGIMEDEYQKVGPQLADIPEVMQFFEETLDQYDFYAESNAQYIPRVISEKRQVLKSMEFLGPGLTKHPKLLQLVAEHMLHSDQHISYSAFVVLDSAGEGLADFPDVLEIVIKTQKMNEENPNINAISYHIIKNLGPRLLEYPDIMEQFAGDLQNPDPRIQYTSVFENVGPGLADYPQLVRSLNQQRHNTSFASAKKSIYIILMNLGPRLQEFPDIIDELINELDSNNDPISHVNHQDMGALTLAQLGDNLTNYPEAIEKYISIAKKNPEEAMRYICMVQTLGAKQLDYPELIQTHLNLLAQKDFKTTSNINIYTALGLIGPDLFDEPIILNQLVEHYNNGASAASTVFLESGVNLQGRIPDEVITNLTDNFRTSMGLTSSVENKHRFLLNGYKALNWSADDVHPYLASPRSTEQVNALIILADIKDPDSIPYVEKVLETANIFVNPQAQKTLAALTQ